MSVQTSSIGRLELDPARAGTRLAARRRRALSAAGFGMPRIALEIGAFDNPTITPEDGFAVRYADYFSSDELRLKHAANPHRALSRIVEVDYVIKGPRLSPFITGPMDLVVANHVIEHIADPIGWLGDIAGFCAPGAAIFLAVPDQRFTFDYFKQPSDVTDLVRAYEERKSAPDAYDVARMRHLHTRVDPEQLWDGGAPARPEARGTYRTLLERARAEVGAGYTDVHCTFWTADAFVDAFTELERSGYLPWRTELLGGVERGGNEFYVLLRRKDAD